MRFAVLGDLCVQSDAGEVPIPGRKERALLAHLLARAGEVVTVDALVEALWGDAPPRTAAKSLQAHVVRLRDALEPDRPRGDAGTLVATHPTGYRFVVAPGALDAAQFEDAVDEARASLRAAAFTTAAEALRRALALWRGPAFAGSDDPVVQAEAQRLEELRLGAEEDLAEAELGQGQHEELVPRLRAMVAAAPLRERRWGLLALALYRAGRQAEALEVHAEARSRLAEELGVDPGSELQAQHAALLAQDPDLDAPGQRHPALPHALDRAQPLHVGRDQELAALRETWRATRAGAGRVVAVVGPPGSGRTRLLAELAAEVHAAGGLVLHGAALPVTSDPLRVLRRAGEPIGLGLDDLDDTAEAARRWAARVVDRRADAGTLVVLDDLDELEPAASRAVAAAAATGRDGGVLVALLGAAPPRCADVEVVLGPLGADERVQVAELYCGPEDAPLAAADLVDVAPWPGPLHDASAAWARRRAALRVEEAAGRLRTRSKELARARADLVVLVQEPAIAPDTAGAAAPACPWPGLRAFEATDAAWFFGREELLADVLTRLVEQPLVALVGASGSGKSSIARAGVVAAVAEGRLPGSDTWEVVVVRPGPDAPRLLAGLAARDTGDTPRLVVVDQLEEVATLAPDSRTSAIALDRLADLVAAPRTRVLVTLRADHLGMVARSGRLAPVFTDGTVVVGPMTAEELHRVVELPARRAGLRLDPGLANALVAEAVDRPGALPLLSTALRELWDRRRGDTLTLQAHRAAGGLAGAVARMADAAVDVLALEEQATARRVLLRMVGVGDGGVVVGRRIAVDELAHEGESGRAVVSHLADRRLLVVDDGTVALGHETLLREWPRLRDWVDEDRTGRVLHQQLVEAARRWDAGGRDDGDLLRGARLAATIEWADTRADECSPVERDLLDASRAVAESERRAAEERATATAATNRRLRVLATGLAVVMVLALLASGVAVQQRGRAAARALAADAARIGAQALVEDDLDRSLLLAAHAVRLDDTLATRSTLLEALGRAPSAVAVFRGDGERFMDGAISPDGALVAAVSSDGPLVVWDAETRARVHREAPVAEGWGVAFAPDGQHLAVSGWADAATGGDEGVVRLLATDDLVEAWSTPVPVGATRVGWSPDGRRLAAMGGDGEVVLLDARTGEPTVLSVPDAVGREPWGAVLLPDGDTVAASWDGLTAFVDIATGRVVERLDRGGPIAASPDGRRLALAPWGTSDHHVVVVDAETGEEEARIVRHTAEVTDLRFGPDGRALHSAGDDGLVVTWDVESDELVEVRAGHRGRTWGLDVTVDGGTLVSASLDGSLVAWDVAGDRRFGQRVAPTDAGPVVAVGHGGDVVVRSVGTGIEVLTPSSGRAVTVALDDEVWALVVLSAERVAAAGAAGLVHVVDLGSSPPRVTRLDPDGGPVGGLARSADGAVLLAGTASGQVVGLDASTGEEVGRVDLGAPVWAMALDVAASRLVATLDDGSVVALDWPTGEQRWRVQPHQRPQGVAVTHGDVVVTGGMDGRVHRWSGQTGESLGQPLHVAAGWVVAADRRGDLLAVGSTDGTLTLVDLQAWRVLGGALPVTDQARVTPGFLDEGGVLALAEVGDAVVFEVDVDAWVARACATAGRELTVHEWHTVAADRPLDREVCQPS